MSTQIQRLATPVKSELDKRVYRVIRLGNQMDAVLVSDPETKKAACAMDVHVGHFSDPDDVPGLAHFCEHMLFLGTEKYPDENSYSKFLSSHGGSSNAYTAAQHTNYFFDVSHSYLYDALDRFSQFFKSPLFTDTATDREMKAVDSENSKNLQTDSRRMYQLNKTLSNEKHPFHKFATGNIDTLKHTPLEKGIDIREELLKFHTTYYSSSIMKLAIVGREDLDTLEAWVVEMFDSVNNNGATPGTWKDLGSPFTGNVGQIVEVVPVRDLRSLVVAWPTPPVNQNYRTNAKHGLSHLLGHEGSGSLFDVIKNKGWATSLSAGMRYNMPDFSLFSVTIDLTVDGLKNTNEIVRLLYQYIALMHGMEEGQWKWTFEEMLALDEMSFRFKSKESPSHFSSSLAQTLHDYPPEHLLNSRYHYPDFDVEKIKSLLSYVSADNCFFTVISKDFEGKTESTEPWYQTQYTVRDMDSELKAIMQNPGPTDLLQLPAENQYIATNFDLITGASATASVDAAVAASDASAASDADIDVDASICTDGKSADADADTNVDVKTARMKKWSKKWKLDDRDMTHPIKIKDDKQMIAFYKPDVTYKKPKLYAYGALVSPSAKGSPETQVASFLLARLVRNKLSSGVYDASLAGLHFVLSGTDEGMKFYFSGYNEKLHVLVEDVFSAIATYHIDTEAYAVEKEKLVRELMSFDKEQPYNHAEVAHDLLLVHKTYHKKVLLSALQSMSAEDFDKLYKELFTACYIRLMVYGNCNEESAHKLANSAYNIIYSPNTDASSSSSSFAEADRVISPRPLYPHEFPESRCIELPEGVNHYYRLTHPSADEKNACLKSTFQIGPDTTETRCMLLLLTHMMREPCFNVLRTKEQLGYLVWSGINVFEGVLSAHITVQSSVRQAGYLDDRAEAFLQYFGNEYLKKEVDEETFLDNIEATIDNRTERPKTMGSQMNRYMKELNRRRFEWTQLSEEVECLKSIKLVDVQAFFDHHFGFNSPHRRKLALQIFAQKSGGDDETKDGDETKNAKEAVTGDAAATDGESGKEGETEKLLPVPVAAADSPVTTTVIEDYVSFQRANPTYPNYWEKVTAKL